ncbi:MAG: hypothetical protein M1835_000593 [Candelina submexicana]|nr:MAG: hypothetical protein M1835_000593 [Candelina submexicana]
MLLFNFLYASHNVLLVYIFLATPATSFESLALDSQIDKRAQEYNVIHNLPLGQPQSRPVCTHLFGHPSHHDCERAAGGLDSLPPRGGMEWEENGYILSQYFRNSVPEDSMLLDKDHIFSLPRTYAFDVGFNNGFANSLAIAARPGDCVIALLTDPELGDGNFDIAAMNTIRWATVKMARDCKRISGQGRVDLDKGGWQVGGQWRKIWMLSIQLPADKTRDRRQAVAINRIDHLDLFSNCDFGSPQNPKAPATACPNWNNRGNTKEETNGADASVDMVDSSVSQETANLGVQYCLEKSGGPGCGWGEEWKEAMPRISSQSELMWGVDFGKIGEKLGTCVLGGLSTDAPT